MSIASAIRIEGSIPADIAVRNNDRFLFISKDQRSLTHAIHKYPAKFFPELPRWIIERYSEKGDFLLDPFCGSGTSNLEAMLLGRNSVGVDVDPFSRFVARVKTTPLPKDELLPAYVDLRQKIENFDERKFTNGIPCFPYRDNWFKDYILKELAYIKASIEGLQTSQRTKDFFLVCFSSIIRKVSEADNNCTRTVIRKKLGKVVSPRDAIKLFAKRLEINTYNMHSFAKKMLNSTVDIPSNADARRLEDYDDNTFDLALTSPPYLNAVDYPRTHQLEMYWLGMANGSLQDLKSQHVGTEIVLAKDYVSLHKTGYALADETIGEIYAMDKRRAFIATKYILDMAANLREVYRVIKPGAAYVVVVGNNLVRGIEFETWRYLIEMAGRLGYKIECRFVSAIINHFIRVPRRERINDDHVIVMRK